MRAIVTGAARGLGAAIADRLEGDGGTVLRVDVLDGPGVHQADVSDEAQVDGVVEAARSRLGGLDLLVNNAGIGGPDVAVIDMDPADFRRTLEVNVVGSFLLARACGRLLVEQGTGGCIVNIGSYFAQQGRPYAAAYSVSKGGVALLTQSLAGELGPHGIRVNTVAPGNMDTDMHHEEVLARAARSGRPYDEERALAVADQPLQRHGTGEDVAGAIAWLASPDASYVTGQTISVNGGLVLS